jgi:hypothetical protein
MSKLKPITPRETAASGTTTERVKKERRSVRKLSGGDVQV